MAVRHIVGLVGLLLAACGGSAPANSPATTSVDAGAVPSQQLPVAASGAAGSRAAEAPAPAPRDAGAEPHAGAPAREPRDAGSAPVSPAADGGMMADAAQAPDEDARVAEPECGDCCSDGFPRGATVNGARKVFNLTPSPEGVTVCPNGAVFLTSEDGQIWRASLDGRAPERWASLPDRQPAGIACDERERLFVAIYGVRSGNGAAGVMRIDARDKPAVELPQPPEASPFASYNGVLAIPGLGVYATDSGAGWVVRLSESNAGKLSAEIVARSIPIANGLAYDAAKRTLYVASSLGMAVFSFSVAADGTLSNRAQVATQTRTFFDGLAVDEQGRVYAADYNGGAVLRLADSLPVAKLTNPASFAFRGGTLLVTDYRLNQPSLEGGLYAIDLGACGAPTR